MPSSQLATLMTVLRARPKRQLADAARARSEFEAFTKMFPGPDGLRTTAVTLGSVAAEWVVAPPAPEPPAEGGGDGAGAILFFHGGGYASGSLATHRGFCGRLFAATGLAVLQVDYRLAPEHPFPAAYDDAVAACHAFLERGLATPERWVVAGDSAGGGLALAAVLALRDAGAPLPAALALLSPWTDLAVTGASVETNDAADPLFGRPTLEEMADLYRGETAADDPRVSPLYGDLHGLPPTFVQVGGTEVMLDDSTRLAARLEAAGVPVELQVWERCFHGWQLYASMLPEAAEAIDQMAGWIGRVVPRKEG